jgi:hypothetical protein
MKKNKGWLVLICLFLLINCSDNHSSNQFSTSVTRMKILVENNKGAIIIYDNRAKQSLLVKIRNSKNISVGEMEKAVINEGHYIIELYNENDELDEIYFIQNDYWISNRNKNIVLRCSILGELRGLLLDYIYENNDIPYW